MRGQASAAAVSGMVSVTTTSSRSDVAMRSTAPPDRMASVSLVQGEPQKVKVGDYTLTLTAMGMGRIPIAPEPTAAAQPGGRGGAGQPAGAGPGVAIFINAAPNEFYMSGANGNIRVSFTANTPGPPIVGLGDVQEGKFVDGKWVVVRQLAGDDTGQGELLTLRPNGLMRVTVYRYE